MSTRLNKILATAFLITAVTLLPQHIIAKEASATESTKVERNFIRQGNKEFNDSNYYEALEAYEKALTQNPASLKAGYNKAVVLSHLATEDNKGTENDPREESKRLFEQIANVARNIDPELSEKAFYNLGNMAFNDEKYDESIELYKNALKITPNHYEARQNLRLAQLKKEEQENKDDQQEQDQQQQQQQQQEQNQQQQEQPQQQKQQMTGGAQQILQTMQNKENATRRKVQQQENEQAPSRRPQTDKPW